MEALMPGKKLIVPLVVLAALLAAVPSFADDAERQTYKAEVEPICKVNTEANEKILKGVRQLVKAGKLGPASKKVFAAARALKRTRTELLAVPKPPEDAARLTKWLGYVKDEIALFETLGRKLKAGEKTQAQKMVLRLKSTADRANNTVLDFEFRYCRFQPSKFI
jgi:predicted Zn-dependent peptidase